MYCKEASLPILDDLQKANKYIFVQDFVKADEILKSLCQKYDEEYEFFFRRVEIATKSNKIDELIFELSEHKETSPQSKAIKFSLLLAKIKKSTIDKKNKTILQEQPKNLDIHFSNYEKIIRLPNRKLKIHRSTLIPDDVVSPLNQTKNSLEAQSDNQNTEKILEEIFSYYNKHPENYAACYLAGCALDHMGNLQEAIAKWKQALNLNTISICTLSILAELQQKGFFQESSDDFCLKLESIDKYLVHGHIETHTEIYNDFIKIQDYKNAIVSLKILSDWLIKQYNSVPFEIEIICLLGIMNAHKLDNNNVAYEVTRTQVENIIISYKKSSSDLKNLIFIAELCEEYELKTLAKNCYFSFLSSNNSEISDILNVAFHCINHYPSEALLHHLKKCYENSKGNAELRFCIILCQLHIKGITPEKYLSVKNKIREQIASNKIEEALVFLEELNQNFADDPEIHYYLAEIYSRKEGEASKAISHFQTMYNLDSYNTEAITKFAYFLLRNKQYKQAIVVCKKYLLSNKASHTRTNEIYWGLAAALFAEENYETSKDEIEKPLLHEPWNISYVTLHLRCCLHLSDIQTIQDAFSLSTRFEEISLDPQAVSLADKGKLIGDLIDYSLLCLKKGYFEIAWSFSKCALLVNKKLTEAISNTLSKTAAAFLPQKTIPQLLVLLKKQAEIDLSFFDISCCIARTYGLTGQWNLVDEWLQMAQNLPSEDKVSKSKLFELEALSMTMQGSDLKKAQNLLEAAIDEYENYQQIPFETKVLHGYLLVAQGNISDGLEKIKVNMNQETSIQSLYFFIKGMERAGSLSSIPRESIEQMRHVYPLNSFEQQMIEEIFVTVSAKINEIPIGLAC